MSAATTAAHSARNVTGNDKLRQESITMDMLEVSKNKVQTKALIIC